MKSKEFGPGLITACVSEFNPKGKKLVFNYTVFKPSQNYVESKIGPCSQRKNQSTLKRYFHTFLVLLPRVPLPNLIKMAIFSSNCCREEQTQNLKATIMSALIP